nr:jerky protein homolog-like [Nomia melanderi]
METVNRKKYNHLTISQRLEILEKVEEGVPVKHLANEFGVTAQTIYYIKRHAVKFRQQLERKHPLRVNQMKIKDSTLHELDDKLYLWFIEQKALGNIINDKILQEKASELQRSTFGGPSTFECSRGWIWRFKKRHGIYFVQVANESVDPKLEEAENFVITFAKYLKENDITLNNLYNMDETRLMWKSLPRKTLASCTIEKVSDGKLKKDRVTVGFCANATGTHKLPPLFIHKFLRPRALKHEGTLSVVYKMQRSAGIDKSTFEDWYENYFKPQVQQRRLENGDVGGKVILLLENCSSHILPAENLKDGNFEIMYLPPNIAPILQPMDQGIIAKIKLRFRHSLIKKVLQCSGEINKFYKDYNIKDCIATLDTCWQEVTAQNVRNSWRKILKGLKGKTMEEEEEEGEETNDSETPSIVQMLKDYTSSTVNAKEIEEWMESCDEEERRPLNIDPDEREDEDAEENEDGDEKETEQKDEEKKEITIEKALSLIVDWSKKFDLSVQMRAHILKDFYEQGQN